MAVKAGLSALAFRSYVRSQGQEEIVMDGIRGIPTVVHYLLQELLSILGGGQ